MEYLNNKYSGSGIITLIAVSMVTICEFALNRDIARLLEINNAFEHCDQTLVEHDASGKKTKLACKY